MNYGRIFISLCIALAVGMMCSTVADMAWAIEHTELTLVKHFGVGFAVGSTFLIAKSKLSS